MGDDNLNILSGASGTIPPPYLYSALETPDSAVYITKSDLASTDMLAIPHSLEIRTLAHCFT